MRFFISWKKFICLFICLIIFNGFSTELCAEEMNSSGQINFMAIADIHFDPFISCNGVVPCPLIQKLRQSNVSLWPNILIKYDNAIPNFGKDTNYPLLKSAFMASKQAAKENHVKFVLLVGDYLGHNFRSLYKKYSQDKSQSGYQTFVNKVFKFLAMELAQAFPETNIYPVVGNNDSYHYDYYSQPRGAFFNDAAKIFSDLVKNNNDKSSLLKEFSHGGYYAIDLGNNLRLIVLNTVFFSIHAKGHGIKEAANEELEWLKQQLELTQSKQQKAIIAMHIPMSVDVYMSPRLRLFTVLNLWQKQYITAFKSQLEKFAPNIVAIMGAHLHSDWFQYLEAGKNEIATMGASAVSPFFGNNPSFKIYRFSPQTLELSPIATYYYSLHERKSWKLRGF